MRLKLTSRGTSDERNGKISGGDECRLVNDVTEVRGTATRFASFLAVRPAKEGYVSLASIKGTMFATVPYALVPRLFTNSGSP